MNNTTEYNPLHFTIKEKRIFGLIILTVIMANVIPYVIVIRIFFKNKIFSKHMAYRIMGHIGLNELFLQVDYFAMGIMALTNTDFGFFMNKAAAVISCGNWMGCLFFVVVLAVNRFGTLIRLSPNFNATDDSRKMFFNFLILISHIISISWIFIFSLPGMGMEIRMMYFKFEPRYVQYNLLNVEITYTFCCLGFSWILYIISFINLLYRRMKFTENQQVVTHLELSLLIQSMIICVYKTLLQTFIWYTMEFVSNVSKFVFLLCIILNCHEQGYNAYIYLIFNRTVRTEFLRILGIKKHKVYPQIIVSPATPVLS